MELQRLKSLRTKIPISLNGAIELMKKHQGNIEACIKDFHDKKIDEICTLAKCDRDRAKIIYKKFNFDKEKAVKEIKNEQKIISIENHGVSKNAIGFILWFEDGYNEQFKTEKRNDIFIPTEDFDYIKEEFESNCSKNFDITNNNYFNSKECKLILEALEEKNSKNQNQDRFLNDLKNWMIENLKFREMLVVYGNL